VTGGKKSGAGPLAMKREARELAVALRGRQAALDEQVARLDALHPGNHRSRSRGGAAARLAAIARERTAWRSITMRKLGDDLSRTNSRLSVARLELERLRRDAEKSAGQRERNRAAVEEKERLRAAREERSKPSGRSWR
jgi:chromosome segregation protein